MSVAYQGVPGAFSHEACRSFLGDERSIGRATFAEVIETVLDGEADLGMLPFENNSAGAVEEVQALLAASDGVEVVARHVLPIRIHLLGLPGSEVQKLRTAVSHPMALKQCAQTLASLGLAAEAASNTAAAAQTLADPTKAVLASEAAAEAYGLVILRHDLQDSTDNATTFCVIARKRL
ncbi:MAG: prephenate dehydratase [Alphaproteobacteria bacterium]|nr:prephenate dehydratase [Alphaproteobacteria bacterium]